MCIAHMEQVRRALDWLQREGEKLQENDGKPRIMKQGSNAVRAVAVLAEARISWEQLYKEKVALSAIASYLRPGTAPNELQASIVRLLATAAQAVDGMGDGYAALLEHSGGATLKRPAWHTELQTLLGVTYKAIASILEIAKKASGAGVQVDALSLMIQLQRDNEEAQAESVRCDVVAICTRKMTAGDDPVGQVASAGCLASISTSQGLNLMLDTHSLDAMCAMVRCHAEPVKIAAVGALALVATRVKLQAELDKLDAFESLVRLLYEPRQDLVACTLVAMKAFLKLGGKTEEHAERLRRYAALAVKNDIVQGVLDLGIHFVQSEEVSLACMGFVTMSLKLLVPDEPKNSSEAPVVEKKKEDVLDRKSRRGLNALSAGAPAAPATPDTTAKVYASSGGKTSSKPLLVQLLNNKTLFVEWIVCLLSTSNVRVHQATMDLMTLSMDRKRDFVAVFSVPSVCWAMLSVFAREEREESMRETALKKLVDLIRLTTGCGAHLHNKLLNKLAEHYKVRINAPASFEPQVANANKKTVQLDIQNALTLLLDKNLDTLIRCQVLVWIRCMVRADGAVRQLLTESGTYLDAVMAILKGDLSNYPLMYKTRCLEVLVDTLLQPSVLTPYKMLHPVTTLQHQYVKPIALQTFSYFMQYLIRQVEEQRESRAPEQEALGSATALGSAKELGNLGDLAGKVAPPVFETKALTAAEKEEGTKKAASDLATQELTMALGYVVIGMVRSNMRMQIVAARMGMCQAALDMLDQRNAVGVRRLGADMLGAVCDKAPALARIVLSVGEEHEFIERTTLRSDHESMPPVLQVLMTVVTQMQAAEPPQFDTAALDNLSGEKRQEKLADFEAFAAKAQMEELKRLQDLEPLLVSALDTLLLLCGADHTLEAAGVLDGRWNHLRSPLSFVQGNVRYRFWSENKMFETLAKLLLNKSPTVVYKVLPPYRPCLTALAAAPPVVSP